MRRTSHFEISLKGNQWVLSFVNVQQSYNSYNLIKHRDLQTVVTSSEQFYEELLHQHWTNTAPARSR